MFAASKSSLFTTMILGLLFMLFGLPLATYALPAALPSNPTSLMGRVYTSNYANTARTPSAEVPGNDSLTIVLRAADEQPIKRADRFQRRMERAKRLAQPEA